MTLRNKTTVTVSVVIDSDGNVISAKASGGASASIRRACEQAAKGAKWSPKKGAGETRGSISFTITPDKLHLNNNVTQRPTEFPSGV